MSVPFWQFCFSIDCGRFRPWLWFCPSSGNWAAWNATAELSSEAEWPASWWRPSLSPWTSNVRGIRQNSSWSRQELADSFNSTFLFSFSSHHLAPCYHSHDRKVPDFHDLRHRLPVHCRVVPYQGPKRGRRNSLHFRQDRIHVRALHRGSAGI